VLGEYRITGKGASAIAADIEGAVGSGALRPGDVLPPLRELAGRVAELGVGREAPVVVVCRSGVRSSTAAAILTSLGFEDVSNLKGGMLAWNDLGLPVEHA